jgi:uncharacterized membrane protein
MKTIMLILPLTGVACLVFATEPVKPEISSTTVSLSATRTASPSISGGGLDAADKTYTAKLGDRLARSGTLTTKAERSANQGFIQSVNPFVPTKPTPTTPWLSRVGWSTAAESAASSTPIEVRHEAKCGVVVCSK